MLKKIKNVIMTFALLATVITPALVPATGFAANNIAEELCRGTNFAASETGDQCSTNESDPNQTLRKVATTIVNILSVVVGIIAVIMIIVGGFKYITSGGDSGNVSGAKNTLIYAIVGLIIVALAQFIVHFVLDNVGV